jgi:predicted nucleic acid-binding protein
MDFTTKIVIDANTWLRFVLHAKHKKLIDIIDFHRFEVYANNYLLSEIFDTCVGMGIYTTREATNIIQQIRYAVFKTAEHAIFRLSPDPKHNYLFDLAIQKNCSFIVSDDGLLQRMKLKPVPVKSTNWFLKHYPI